MGMGAGPDRPDGRSGSAEPAFDPYHRWLGIPPQDQPADHYRLLGIARFESNLTVIESAADRQMNHVRTFQLSAHKDASQKLLNELSAARVCLLNPAKKQEYDARLQATERQQAARLAAQQAAQQAAAAPRVNMTPDLPVRAANPQLGGYALAEETPAQPAPLPPSPHALRRRAMMRRIRWVVSAMAIVSVLTAVGFGVNWALQKWSIFGPEEIATGPVPEQQEGDPRGRGAQNNPSQDPNRDPRNQGNPQGNRGNMHRGNANRGNGNPDNTAIPQDDNGNSQFGQPPYTIPPNGNRGFPPQFNQPPFGQPPFGQPPFGQPPFNRPPVNRPPNTTTGNSTTSNVPDNGTDNAGNNNRNNRREVVDNGPPLVAPRALDPDISRLMQSALVVFNFEDGTYAPDSSRNNTELRDLSPADNWGRTEGAVKPAEGIAGQACEFDGATGSIRLVTLRPKLTANLKTFSISLWHKVEVPKFGMLFDCGTYPGQTFNLTVSEDFRYQIICGKSEPMITGRSLGAEKAWQHVVVVFASTTVRLYLDGKLTQTWEIPETVLDSYSIGSTPAFLAGQSKVSGRELSYYRGALDEIAIFAQALTADDVDVLHAWTKLGRPLPEMEDDPQLVTSPAHGLGVR